MEPLVSDDPTRDGSPEDDVGTEPWQGYPRRYRLFRFRRFRPDPPPVISPDDPDYYEPTAEDFLPSAPKPRSPMSRWPETAALKPAILCFILFWAASIHEWRYIWPTFTASGETVFGQGEWWRLLSALFTHADVGHLLANTPLFLIFGWYLRAYFGPLAFPFGALVVGVLSNLATIAIYPAQEELLGASGMLYGMVALWLVLYVRFETLYTIPMRAFRALAVSVLLLFPTTFEKTVSYLAHATGFSIGIAVGLILMLFVRLRI
jgi:membrane associated rhomboid family serine protease